MLDDIPKLPLRHDGLQDLRVEVREGGGLVGGDHPVALDADDARGGEEGGGERDVRVWVREAWVRRAPGVVVCWVGGRGVVRGRGRGRVRAEGGVRAGRVGAAVGVRVWWGVVGRVALLEVGAGVFVEGCLVGCSSSSSSAQPIGAPIRRRRCRRHALTEIRIAIHAVHFVSMPSPSYA